MIERGRSAIIPEQRTPGATDSARRPSLTALVGHIALAVGELVVFCVVTGLLASVAGLDAPATMGVVAAWFLVAFAAQRALRAVGVSWRLWLAVAILLAAIAIPPGAKLILAYPHGLADPRWLQALGADAIAGGLSSLITVTALVGATLIWGRASWLGQSSPRFRDAAQSFQTGIAVLMLVYGVAALLGRDLPSATPLGLAFFFFGTLSIAVSHRQEVAGRGDRHIEGLWLWLLVASVVLALLVGTLVGLLLDGDILRQIVAGIAALLGLIGRLLEYLASLFPSDTSSPAVPPPVETLPQGEPQRDQVFKLFSDEVREFLQVCWMIVFVGLFGLAVLRVLGDILAHLFRSPALANATVEKVPTNWRDEVLALLRALRGLLEELQWALQRRLPRRKESDPGPSGDVREAYRALLFWTAKRGLRRTDQETPYEFLRRLVRVVPSGEADLRILTDCYVLARYCPRLLTKENHTAALASWRRLRHTLRRAPTHRPRQEPRQPQGRGVERLPSR